MRELIIEALSPDIMALPFIERYGGLVQQITRAFEVGEDSTGGPVFEYKSFPVSCQLTNEECWELEKYKNLVPDDSYKSVSYFEADNRTTTNASGTKLNEWTYTTTIRFVCWLNLPALGINDCKGTGRFEVQVSKAVMGHKEFSIDGVDGSLHIRNANLVEKSASRIFGRYSYGDKEKVYFFPYDFFAIDFDISMRINANCIPALTLSDPIDCITNW